MGLFYFQKVLKPSPKEPPVEKEKVANPYAIARPHATDLMYQRQTSFKGLGQLNQVKLVPLLIAIFNYQLNIFHGREVVLVYCLILYLR